MVGFQTDYKTTFTIHLSKIWKGAFPLENSNNRNPTHLNSIFMDNNVWFIKNWTTHNLPLWLYEYFWIISLYGNLVYFILKVLAWKICIMKWGFAKKSHNKVTKTFYVWFEFLWIRRYHTYNRVLRVNITHSSLFL